MSLPLPSDAQLDALREVANIGAGHAANALSRMMGGRQVDLSVPRVVSSGAADAMELLGGDAPLAAAWLGTTGLLRGSVVLALSARDGAALESLLLGSQTASPEDRDSALCESANILASACLSAVGKLTGWKLMPTVPTLLRASASQVLDAAVRPAGGDPARVVVLEARFGVVSVPPVSGQVLLVLERDSVRALLGRLGL